MKKIVALFLVLVMVFSIGCACAASDPDILTIDSQTDATALALTVADKGWSADLYLCAFGAVLMENNIIPQYHVIVSGLVNSELQGYDVAYTWDKNTNVFGVMTENLCFAFPGCANEECYEIYKVLLITVMDEQGYSYNEVSLDA